MSLPRAHGAALGTAVMRQRSEDFVVEELLGFEADGEGPHRLVKLCKVGANTAWVAAQLARHAGVPERDVGYSGLKDRHAVTTQYYSVPADAIDRPVDWDSLSIEGVTLIEVLPHRRKLRRGSHRGNRFRLRLRELQADPEAVQARLRQLAREGFPNYFGEQRFGHGQRDPLAQLLGPRRLSHAQRGFALSALRAQVFNAVLARRVSDGSWNRALPGEALLLDGRGSWFVPPALDEELLQRIDAGELHPSGPLPGSTARPVGGCVAALEAAVLEDYPGLPTVVQRYRLEADRRALRCIPRELRWQWPQDQANTLELAFELPRGCYATMLLHELFDMHDAAAP